MIETARVRRAAAAFVGRLSSVLVLLAVAVTLAEPPATVVDSRSIINSLQQSGVSDRGRRRSEQRLPRIDLDIDNMKRVADIMGFRAGDIMGFRAGDIKILFNEQA